VVEGEDAASYLQGQCSQDLSGLATGESLLSFLLSPRGKVDALVRVVRLEGSRFVVEVEEGFGGAVHDRLARFKVRVKATLRPTRLALVEVRGPLADAVATHAGSLARLAVDWPGYRGVDLLGETVSLPPGVLAGDPQAFEAARIEAGVPAMGRELTPDTIPHETGIVERAVSFTKGCYTGQELVARLDARGAHVARRLVGVVAPGAPAGALAPGDGLRDAGRVVGEVTSASFSPRLAGAIGLAYLRRAVLTPCELEVVRAEAVVGRASVRDLPL